MYHKILTIDFEEYLRDLNAIQFSHQRVDSLSTLFKYPFGRIVFGNSERKFDNVEKAEYLNQETEEWTELPAVQKGILTKKIIKQH